MADSPEAIQKHMRLYWGIFLALLMFTGLTIWVATVDLGSYARNLTVGMIIALTKASLVALFFMHLSNERRIIYRVLAFTFVFFLGLMFLTLWSYWDEVHFRGYYH